MRVTRILVPIDFSKDSLNALSYARELAASLAAELLLLHVVDQTYLAATPELHVANPKLAQLLDEQWADAKTQLARIGGGLENVGQRFRTILKRGNAAQVIVETAKRSGTDLVIMGTHGRTGLAHMLIGSVAEKVVRTAACPVLTVRRAVHPRRPRRTVGPAR